MIIARISDMSGQGAALCYLAIACSLGEATSVAECYINPTSSIAVQHAIIADACRQALSADSEEPVRLLTGIVEIT